MIYNLMNFIIIIQNIIQNHLGIHVISPDLA